MERNTIHNFCANPTYTIKDVIDIVKNLRLDEMKKGRNPFSQYYYLFPILKRHEIKFKEYTRMTLNTFEYILSKVSLNLQKDWCNLHQQPIIPEEKLVITMRFLATGAAYSDLSYAFLMAKSTICYLIDEVITVLWDQLGPIHMPVPTTDRLIDIAEDFYLLWDLPHCVGAIDGRHIRIKKPSGSGRRYFNYKKFFSIVLQALVDARYKFIVIDVGGYGHQHDATTFLHSTLYKALQQKKIKFPEEDELYYSDEVVPYFMVGDGAYPFSENLLKPYSGKNLSANQKLFNKRLSRGRVVVECAFGHLCQKWRIFYSTMNHPPKKVEKIVKAACLLHNLIIDLEKPTTIASSLHSVDQGNLIDDERETNILLGDGEPIRRQLTQFFLDNPVLVLDV